MHNSYLGKVHDCRMAQLPHHRCRGDLTPRDDWTHQCLNRFDEGISGKLLDQAIFDVDRPGTTLPCGGVQDAHKDAYTTVWKGAGEDWAPACCTILLLPLAARTPITWTSTCHPPTTNT